MGDLRTHCGGVLSLALVMFLGSVFTPFASAGAEISSEEKVRLLMLDTCIYQEWRRKGRQDKAAARCQCASKAAVKKMTAQERTKIARKQRLTRPQQVALNGELAKCG